MFCNDGPSRQDIWRGALAFLGVWLATASPLWAQIPCDTDFCLQISEKENQLAHPDDAMWMKANMWDVGYQRMYDRNRPVLELTNGRTNADITRLELTIGDTRFQFNDDLLGAFALLGDTTPGYTLTFIPPADINNVDVLTLNITKDGGGGLGPGETVRFKIDIDVDPGHSDPPFFIHPDFRTVMFDINANGGNMPKEVYDGNIERNSSDDNAAARVTFSDNANPTPFAFFPDQVINGPNSCTTACAGPQNLFFNNIFRTYGIMEPVDIFPLGGGGVVIPEPASGLLALVGVFGGIGMTRRPRRRG